MRPDYKKSLDLLKTSFPHLFVLIVNVFVVLSAPSLIALGLQVHFDLFGLNFFIIKL